MAVTLDACGSQADGPMVMLRELRTEKVRNANIGDLARKLVQNAMHLTDSSIQTFYKGTSGVELPCSESI